MWSVVTEIILHSTINIHIISFYVLYLVVLNEQDSHSAYSFSFYPSCCPFLYRLQQNRVSYCGMAEDMYEVLKWTKGSQIKTNKFVCMQLFHSFQKRTSSIFFLILLYSNIVENCRRKRNCFLWEILYLFSILIAGLCPMKYSLLKLET